MFTPDVQKLFKAILRVRETAFPTMKDGFEILLTFEKEKDNFLHNVSKLWYKLKPKKQIEILDLILSELDYIRQSPLTGLMREDVHEDSPEGKLMSEYWEGFCNYKYAISNKSIINIDSEVAQREVPIEDRRILYPFILDWTFRELYEETWFKYYDVAGEAPAAQWIFDLDKRAAETERWVQEIQAKPTPVGTDSKPSANTPSLTPPAAISPPTELPGLKWEKSVADIGELFYRLAKGGFINLREYREPNTGNLSALCRHICRLFQIPPEKSKDAAAALKAVLNTLLRGDTMESGPVDEQLLWKKPLDRRPGNNASARVAAAIPKENSVGES